MALRDQPYLPLYIQDFITDEKVIECSAESTGVYIFLMCIMHKSDPYGTILLKQKDKQTGNQIKDFALKLVKHLPYTVTVIERSLTELITEDVIQLGPDMISQKRMIKDNNISLKRSEAGSKGGKSTQKDNKFAKSKKKAKAQANTEDENENVNEDINGSDYVNFTAIWFEFFTSRNLPKPGFDAAQGKALKEIIKKIKESSNGTQSISGAFKYILDHWDNQDDWIKSHALDLKIFNSKFNVIINQLKNGKAKVTDSDLVRIANEMG